MRWLAPVAAVCLGLTTAMVAPAFVPEEPASRFEAAGVQVVRHRDFEKIDAVLKKRAPGWGILLRSHVAQAIAEEAEQAGFDPLLVLAVISVESSFQEDAESVVGARGLMQVRPATLYFMAESEGLRLSRAELDADPSLNVRLGVRYLKAMRDRFRNLDLALMAYNAGPTRVAQSLRENALELEQFQGYVKAVKFRYGHLKLQHGESGDWAMAQRDVPRAEVSTR